MIEETAWSTFESFESKQSPVADTGGCVFPLAWTSSKDQISGILKNTFNGAHKRDSITY